MKSVSVFLHVFFLLASMAFGQKASNSQYQILYEADREGNPISGSLAELVEWVNNGNPVRVGWELTQKWPDTTTVMTHWTDGGFVTTQRGHVFTQIRGIFGQGVASITSEKPGVFFSTDKPNSWVAVIGTTGVMKSKFQKQEWMDGMSDKDILEMETRRVRTKWAVMVR